MFQLAVYGKGGIGKSTMSANISLALAERGRRVMQIGCDPKHDSTRLLLGGGAQETVLDYVRRVPAGERRIGDIVRTGSGGVMCIESGGPEPGIGCAGRGILTSFETLKRLGADSLGADVRVYDVLGDVVCGGFAVPLREENADGVLIITSGEFMALYAANNIMKGLRRFAPDRPRLMGLVLNSRGVEGEAESVRRFAEATGTRVVATVPRDRLFAEVEAAGRTVREMFPDSDAARAVDRIVARVEEVMAGAPMDSPVPLDDGQLSDLAAGREIRPRSGVTEQVRVCSGCDVTAWSRRQKYSCASCGALMALARLSDTAIVVHGPASCAYLMDSSYLSTVADLYAGGVCENPMPDNIYSTRMDEQSAIFGGAGRLRETLARAASDGFGEIIVITTCVSGMIGDDCEAVARGFMEDNPGTEVMVMGLDGVTGGDYHDGMDAAIGLVVSMVSPSADTVPGTVNLVGSTFFDLQTREAAEELRRMLSVFGLRVNCRMLDETTAASVRGFCSAEADILLNEYEAGEMEDRIRSSAGRDVPVIRIPTGFREYAGWLDAMARLTGMTEAAEAELSRAEEDYSRFVESRRGSFEGRRVAISTCIDRQVDWLVEALGDLGAEVVRLGYLKYEGGDRVTRLHGDMLVHGYTKEMAMRDWEDLRPDILLFDVDIPDDYPGPSLRMSRIGPGLHPMMGFLDEAAEVLGRGCGR